MSYLKILLLSAAFFYTTHAWARPFYNAGLTIYNDPLAQVVGPELSYILGNIEGISLRASYNNYFAKRTFYYKLGLSLDKALAKKIEHQNITYTLDQYRIEAPLLVGMSFAVRSNRLYMGTGYAYNLYNLSVTLEGEGNLGGEQVYRAAGLARVIQLGLAARYSARSSFYTEVNILDSSLKGSVDADGSRSDILINPKYIRLYFGFTRPL